MSLNLDKSDWKRTRLGDVIRRSRTQVDPFEAGVERYVGGGHVDSDSITIKRWGHPTDGHMGSTFTYAFEPGQILFVSARPYLRKIGVVNFSGVVADKTYVLDAAPQNGLLQEFLPFVLSSAPFIAYATAEATGSMNPRLLWGPLQRYEFALPPLHEQKRIADLLWSIERHREAVMDNAARLAVLKSLWIEGKLLSGMSDRGWTAHPVPKLLTSGPTNGKSAPANDEERGVPTLSLSAIRDGRVLGGPAVKYIDVNPTDVASFVIESDDFLVVRGNGNKQLTGLGGLASGGLPDGCVYPDLLIRLRFNRDIVLPEFGAVQWNSGQVHRELIKKAKSTNGIWKINGKDIKSHRLVVPPVPDQVGLLKELAVFDEALRSLCAESEALDALRSSLLADVLGGN